MHFFFFLFLSFFLFFSFSSLPTRKSPRARRQEFSSRDIDFWSYVEETNLATDFLWLKCWTASSMNLTIVCHLIHLAASIFERSRWMSRFYLFELKLNYFVCLFIYGYGVFGFKHVRGEMVQNEERERRAVKARCYALD